MQFAVENEADVMSYFDHYIPPELMEMVVDQTNLYAQQKIVKMPRPVTKHARSEEWKPVTIIEMKKFLGLIFVTGIVWCSSASRRLLHMISHAETLLKVCSKFQVFISYSFCVIIFLMKS